VPPWFVVERTSHDVTGRLVETTNERQRNFAGQSEESCDRGGRGSEKTDILISDLKEDLDRSS
jgi:hypothetical protein